MSYRGAKVRKRCLAKLLAKTLNGKSARLEFQYRGNTIQQFKAIPSRCHAMGMQINEAGADYQSARIHHICSLKGSLADRRDLAGPNTHRPHSIQPTLRVDQPAVINRDIVGLRRLTTGNDSSTPVAMSARGSQALESGAR